MSNQSKENTRVSEQELTKAIGQFLYQSIKEEWLTAYMTLSCLDAHSNNDKQTNTFVCTAYYTSAFHPEKGESIEDKMIETNDEIKEKFEILFTMAQEKSGKQWAEATFSIERSGNFNLNFIDDAPFE